MYNSLPISSKRMHLVSIERFAYSFDDGDSEKYFNPFRHALVISHLLQLGNFESLKQGLIEGAKGKWLSELQPDTFLYQSDEHTDFQAYGNSLNWFYPTIMPLLEAHIVLQQKNIYTDDLILQRNEKFLNITFSYFYI